MDDTSNRPLCKGCWDFIKPVGWFASGMAVVGVCLLFRSYGPADAASAAKPPEGNVKQASSTAPAKQGGAAAKPNERAGGSVVVKKPAVAAIVNNEPISREDLARECLLHYGAEVLEAMTNRMLIATACQQRKITITDKQVEEEIDRQADWSKLSRDQWLKLLEKERGLKPMRYARDVIWPTLALRELAKNQLTVSRKELDQAYESEYGPSMLVRLIACNSAAEAQRVHALAVAKPEDFNVLAKNHSQDPNSASSYGLIREPIRRHTGDPHLEEVAFELRPEEISKPIKVGTQYVFLKCQEHIPAKHVSRAEVEPLLAEAIRDRKLHAAAGGIFQDLQAAADVQVIYGSAAKAKQNPGIAAIVNGQKITVLELAEECIERYGVDVLQGTINRKLLDQALRARKQTVNDEDLENEIARAALMMGITKPDGSADIEAWTDRILKNEKITREVYLRDEVWPSVALKKLVADQVSVTQKDLQNGYEANYGPRTRCRAIVLNNMRRAQEVWEMARQKPTAKYFGDLAEQYSVEASSRELRGEVPPIQRHGGQPELENEAFTLSPENRLSGIVQVAGMFIILFYEGQTDSINASFDEVKEYIYRDVHEKKLRVAMSKTFEAIKQSAKIDNYLAGEFKLPKKDEQNLAAEAEAAMPKAIMRK